MTLLEEVLVLQEPMCYWEVWQKRVDHKGADKVPVNIIHLAIIPSGLNARDLEANLMSTLLKDSTEYVWDPDDRCWMSLMSRGLEMMLRSLL